MSEGADAETKPRVELPAEKAALLAKYDLTPKMTSFLDRHLIFQMLEFLQETGMYKTVDVTKAEIALLEETNMIDFAMEKYTMIGEEAPESLSERREAVIQEVTEEGNRVMKLLEILEDEDSVKRFASFKSVSDLCEAFELEPEVIDGLAHYAKLKFDCGEYWMSSELLKHYRSMISVEERSVTTKSLSCVWGSLASLILNLKFTEAAEAIFTLDESLESSKMSKREVLLQRTWLLHWTLFALFTGEKIEDKVKSKLLDFFLNEKSLSIISLSCPHLFRFVGACLILDKRLKNIMKDTVWILNHEAGSYSDPVTRFLLALYTDMDFDEAQGELKECAVVCQGDYFLMQHWAEFQENARLLIFETYCRIHQCINIRMIAEKLNMEAEDAELWIVKLIQHARLDARIDSEKSRVVMSKAPPNVYQQVIEKTKNLSRRSTMLLSNLEKGEKDKLASVP